MSVVHGSHAFSDATLRWLTDHIAQLGGRACWSASTQLWDARIVGLSTPILVHCLDADLGNALLTELYQRRVLAHHYSNEPVMVYAWSAGSCIPWHNDYGDKLGLTVYLNQAWNPNHGGAFCWQDWPSTDVAAQREASGPPVQAQMMFPRHNAYVMVTEAEWHAVSLTTPDALVRMTLQLFLPRTGIA